MTKRNIGIIGDRIRKARERLGLSQEDLSAALHIQFQALGRWERGEVDPTSNAIKQLARELESTSDYLFGLTDEPGDSPEKAALSVTQRKLLWLIDHGMKLEAIEVIAGLPEAGNENATAPQ